MELYQHLGFNRNPFSTYSAEEESDFLGNIYINPKYFSSLKSDIANGHSRFILGARGIGKTALLSQLKSTLESEGIFSIIIDTFDNIPISNNGAEIVRLIVECLIKYYCIELSRNPKQLHKLNKIQKEKLSFIIEEFFITLSSMEYNELKDKTNIYRRKNFLKQIYNRFFNKPINFIISGCMEIAADAVRKSLGLPDIDKEQFYKNYLPEFSIESMGRYDGALNYKSYKLILSDFVEIIKSSGFANVVIFFDKIDEYTRLNNNISLVAGFLEDILKDTTILMNSSYSIVFSIWDAIKPELTDRGVRFDKIKPNDITWSNEDIRAIIEKRIKYFSKGQVTLDSLIKDKEIIEEVINLSNHSPRYIFRLLSYIYDCQSEINQSSDSFEIEAIQKGENIYCSSFDWYAIYPTRTSGKVNIITNINRLLKIGKPQIKTNDYVSAYKVSTPTAISYIQIALNYNLIKELPETEGGAKLYTIIDTVVNHLIRIGIPELQK